MSCSRPALAATVMSCTSAPPSRMRWAHSNAICTAWSNRLGRVARASVRWNATGIGSGIDSMACSTMPRVRPGGPIRPKNGTRFISASAASRNTAAVTADSLTRHSSMRVGKRWEISWSCRLASICTPPSMSRAPTWVTIVRNVTTGCCRPSSVIACRKAGLSVAVVSGVARLMSEGNQTLGVNEVVRRLRARRAAKR